MYKQIDGVAMGSPFRALLCFHEQSQSAFTYSNLTIETPEQSVKFVQS